MSPAPHERPFAHVVPAARQIPAIAKLLANYEALVRQQGDLRVRREVAQSEAGQLVAVPDEVVSQVNAIILATTRQLATLDEQIRDAGRQLVSLVEEHRDEWTEKHAVPAIAKARARLAAAVDELEGAIADLGAQQGLKLWLAAFPYPGDRGGWGGGGIAYVRVAGVPEGVGLNRVLEQVRALNVEPEPRKPQQHQMRATVRS